MTGVSRWTADAYPAPRGGAGAWGWAPPLAALLLGALIAALGANARVFEWLNRLPEYTGDALWANLTMFGDTVVAFALLLPWARRRPDIVWAVFLAALPATLWVDVLKPLLHHPRPAALLPPDLVHVIGPRLLANSFPSGHTTTIFVLAGVLALSRSGAGWRAACLGFAVLIGASRSAVGAHWPLDELGGAFGGWLSAWAGVAWARRWHWGLRPWPHRSFTALLVACALALFFHDGGYAQARPLLYLLAVLLLAGTAVGWIRAGRAAG
ncbi:phosphatase PAP2 family protein [Acidihalobacter prosperus]|uniref:Phosphatidic acid phosphatase type 2/haloperoxidase domain-containing protein n=1 Tax=Acidihalobacter prosperus TaxID=160660 RepID=A0A1A6C6D1_9GAMM|nr:phosphatase PAP2 family protein [Acidihalobacter prosperus]OBS10123.1 hypothetical protein Thpro_021173 [Acidihalobacter prosperus]